MKKIELIVIFLTANSLISCDWGDYETLAENCVKEKYESHSYGGFLGFGKKNDAPKDIDEALYNFDFETARAYLGCYAKVWKNKVYNYMGLTPYGSNLVKINKAEISYFLKNGKLERAVNVIKEYGDYENLYDEYIYPKLLEAKEYEEIYRLLSTVNFTALTLSYDELGHGYEQEVQFRKEISSYHEKLDNLINQAIVEKDRTWAKKWLAMYKDDIDVAKSQKLKDVYYKKSKEYLNAVQKLKAAGLY